MDSTQTTDPHPPRTVTEAVYLADALGCSISMLFAPREGVFVDARHAGGPLTVKAGEYLDRPAVDVGMPGLTTFPLRPDEAMRFAVAVVAACTRLLEPEDKPLRRPVDATDELMGLDG